MINFIRNSLKFGGPSFMSIPIVYSQSKERKEENSCYIRPSQLPLYKEPNDTKKCEYYPREKSKLEESVSTLLKEVESLYGATKELRETADHIYETGKAHSLVTLSYLVDEENISTRYGAIGAGGVLGYVIGGWRKGIIKKLFYATLGAGGVASLLYPDDAYNLASETMQNAGAYSSVAYNFIAGVKPQITSQTIEATVISGKQFDVSSADVKGTSERPSLTSISKDVILTQSKPILIERTQKPIGDIGQSNPDDSDLYTTRS